MQRVIGLDIGSYSIKAVEIVNTLNSYEITNFYENVIPHLEGVPLDSVVPSCMEQLFKENNLEADRIVTAMPGQFISSRALTFNFSDPKKIELAIFSEVEEAVPFNMDEMIVDHQILGQAQGKTFALAVMTRKAFLRNFLDLLQRINIDPKLVDVDSLAFYNLSPYMNVSPEESYALVDVGHEKTSVCIVRDGVLRMFRSINLGGRYVTEFLARDLESSFHEAQRVKHRVSRVFCEADQGDDLDENDRFVVERMTLACNAIVKELGRTFYAFKSWEKRPLSRIFLSGGASRVQFFDKFLEDQLEVEAIPYRLDASELKITPELSEHMTTMPQSVAIGMRSVSSVKRHSQINLRKGEFVYVQNYEAMFNYGKSGLKVAGLVFGLLFLSYAAKWYNYTSKVDELRKEYIDELVRIFPDRKKKYRNSNKSLEKLQKEAERLLGQEITRRTASIDHFVAVNSSSPALELLRDISKAIPKDVKVDFKLFHFLPSEEGGRLEIKAETDNFQSVATISDALKTIPTLDNLREVSSGDAPGSGGKVKQFTMRADYRKVGL